MHWGSTLVHIVAHATVLLIIGFFVGFAAQRAEGKVKSVGTYLSYWLYLLAAGSVVCGLIWPGAGHRGWHPGMMQQESAPALTAPAEPPAPKQ